MANPLYQMFSGMGAPSPSFSGNSGMQFQNPVQKMTFVMQAMANPAAFVKQQFPDIPENNQNDTNQVFNYLQQTRGQVSQEQVNQAQQMAGQIRGQGTVR